MAPRAEHELKWVENRPTGGLRGLQLNEVWAYRELIAFLALRDLKIRYKQALLGVGWAILAPLAGALAFTLVFHTVAKVPSDGIPYPAFAFSGFAMWSYVASAVNAARISLVGNVPLVTKVYFPRLCLPLGSVLPGLADLLGCSVVLAALMAWYGIVPGPAMVAVPVLVLVAVLVAIGVATLLATLTVEYRDVHQGVAFLMQLWLLATPVAYPSSVVSGGWRWLYALNPMVAVVDGWRWALLDGPAPGPTALLSTASALFLVSAGLLTFRRAERRFADVI